MTAAPLVLHRLRSIAGCLILLCAAAVFGQAPIIQSQPQDRAVAPGTTVTFSVFASGTLPLTYRWFFNNTQQLFEVSSSLTLQNVSNANAGTYSVIVSNIFGAVTSTPAVLAVLPLLPGMLDTTFNPGTGPNQLVRCVALDVDGRIYLGGEFTTYNGFARGRIARLNPNGTLDGAFPAGTGASFTIFAIAVQDNGQILIGGAFADVNGVARTGLARLNGDGTLDTTFNPNITFGNVWTVVLDRNGRILIGGDFTTVGGQPRNRIARLNADGSVDMTFAPGAGINDSVRAIVLQPDDKILVAGAFTLVGGTPRNRIARLTSSGALDPTFNPGTGANYWVNALALQPDGKVILGGNFAFVADVQRNNLARLNTNGSIDLTFNAEAGPNGAVTSMALQPDGKLIIGGGFSYVNQQPHTYFARLASDGQVDDGFYPEAGANYWVESVVRQVDGNILIGGSFQFVNNTFRSYVARLIGGNPAPFLPVLTLQPEPLQVVPEGGDALLQGQAVAFPAPSYRWQLNGTNVPGATNRSLQLDNLRLVNGGSYRLIVSNSVGSVTSRLAVVNVTPARTEPGAVDIDFYTGSGPDYNVTAIATQSDERAVIAGFFTSVDGASRSYVARLNTNGSLDTSFNPVLDYYANQVATLPSGNMYVAGGFSFVNGVFQPGIAMLTTNGALNPSFRPQYAYGATIYSFVAQTNGQVVMMGYFAVTNGNLGRTNFARLNPDGTIDPTFDAGIGANGYISAMAPYPGGKVLAVGNFVSFNGIRRDNIVRLNSNGSVDMGFNPGSGANGLVNNAAVQPDGKILIVGGFRAFNGMPRHQVARLNPDGSLDLSFDPGEGPSAEVFTVTLQSSGKILIGGQFGVVDGVDLGRVARLNSDGSLDLTFNTGSGANDRVYTIADLPSGKIIVGGAFTYFDNLPRPFVVRLLGSNPPPFAPRIVRQPTNVVAQAGEDVSISVLAVGLPEPRYRWQLGGTNIPGATNWTLTLHNVHASNAGAYTVVITNNLGTVTSLPATLTVIAPSRAPGAPDINFYAGLGPNDRVHAIAIQDDGRAVIGGAFTEVNGTPRNYIARLTTSGSLDTTFNPGLGANDRVFAVAIQPDGKILAGGNFTNVNGFARSRVVRFETNGAVDLSFNASLAIDGEVYAVAVHTNGTILVGGRFSFVSGLIRNGLVRLTSNGFFDGSFSTVLNSGAIVFALYVQPDTKILFGGTFYDVNGFSRPRLGRLNPDGILDQTFVASNPSGTVDALGLQSDGKVLIGGEFFSISAIPRVRVARLLPNSVMDSAFTNIAPNNIVNALHVQTDGKVIIGGTFTNLGNLSFVDEYGHLFTFANYARYRLARLETNGLVDTNFNVGSGFQGGASHIDEYGQVEDLSAVLAIAREPSGKILVGGDFTRVNGITRPYIARVFSREASDAIVIHKGSGMVLLSWETGVLQAADQVTGPWTDIPNAESPVLYQVGEAQKFFRLKFN